MTNEEIIEEILIEAEAYGLRNEVIQTASEIRSKDSSIEPVLSYELAYHQWIK